MIKWLTAWLLVLLWIGTAAAQNPERVDTLRILGVGNSFTDDGMMYLPDLLEEAGIHNVVLARLYHPGCSLEQHCRFYEENSPNYIYYKSSENRWDTVSEQATLERALTDERWDIVVLQQASHFSGLYDSYTPWLGRLISIVEKYNRNSGLKLAWQMTWAYAVDSDHGGFANYGRDQQQMYEAIVATVRRMLAERHFDYLIPTGTAIQNLRAADRTMLRDATRDGYHLDLGVGRYTAACTWFDALIAPMCGFEVRGDRFRVKGGPETTPVDNDTAEICRTAAADACAEPFAVTQPESIVIITTREPDFAIDLVPLPAGL